MFWAMSPDPTLYVLFETRYTVNAAVRPAIDTAGIPLPAAPWPIAVPAPGRFFDIDQ